ncbi:hypothetical protein [uncultured Hydrogenophaga sp.]|uniref:hypothetical protein n=1 Tax=uncultured Hydrogenophaga sp. TaxID=199683 RepID=UPI0025897AED|nr:hypothetical protein [uncultured Hydrogenophaga sp.]
MPAAPSSPTARPRSGLARFDSLRVKLFLAIAGANVVLVMAAYLIYGWSFDRGLVEYLNKADETRLQPLVVRLANGYREHGHWDWIVGDRERWFELSREVLGSGRVPRRAGEQGQPPGAPPPVPNLSLIHI